MMSLINKMTKSRWALFFDLIILVTAIYFFAVKKDVAKISTFSASSTKAVTEKPKVRENKTEEVKVKNESSEVLNAKTLIESLANQEADQNAKIWAAENNFNLEILTNEGENKTYSFEAKSRVYDWDYEQAQYWPSIQKQIIKPQHELSNTDLEMISAFNSSQLEP